MKIGKLEIGTYGLAPLAGSTDLAMRTLCKRYGADFTVTEMVSARGLLEQGKATTDLLATAAGERPVGVQLFGSDPFVMKDAVQRPELAKFDFIDVNMGCPVPKVTKTGAGSALMRTVDRAQSLIACIKHALDKPVTAKFRLGWDERSKNYIELARALEQAGVDGVTLHARTREQGYAGTADWEAIARLRDAVSIPVIANGDITDPESLAACRAVTGCECFLIGRGAVGRPWVFAELKGECPEVNVGEVATEQFMLMRAQYGDRYAIVNMRHHFGHYLRGRVGASALRGRMNTCETVDGMLSLLSEIV